MLSTPRTIFCQTELQFLPIDELKFGKLIARGLYAKLAENEPYAYDNINMTGNRFILSKDSGKSACQIEAHSICIEEREPQQVHLDEFTSIVANVTSSFETIAQRCPPIIAQRCKIQCLSQPLSSTDSLNLLAGKVANVLHAIDPFERPPSFFGVRFRFLPEEMFANDPSEEQERTAGAESEMTTDGSDFITMRFETYAHDFSNVWMEIAATYPAIPSLELRDAERIRHNIERTYRFLTERGKRFLDQFDDKADDI